jgi:hypothetical protein
VDDPASLSDVAAATGLSRMTIRRYLEAGRFPNAAKDPDGGTPAPWRIPLADLARAGLPIVNYDQSRDRDLGDTVTPDTDPADLRRDLAVAQSIAAERLRTIAYLESLTERLVAALAHEDVRPTRGSDEPGTL